MEQPLPASIEQSAPRPTLPDRQITVAQESVTIPQPTLGSLGLNPGTLIAERYRVQVDALSCVGGEAEVHACCDEHTGDTVAVKLYHRVGVQPKAAVLSMLRALDHPHIVRLRAHGQWQNRFFEVMDYCHGGTLGALAPIDERAMRSYLPQVLDGLAYCHAQGIIHRDLKPSNLLFRDAARTEVVLTDFGISSVLDSLADVPQLTQTRARTYDYTAPELFGTARNGRVIGPQISSRSDYYALGITLMHLITGRSPFAGQDEESIMLAHIYGQLPPCPSASAHLQSLLQGLTQHDPANRWGEAQIRSWLAGETVRDDRGRLWQARSPQTFTHPYPGYPAATTPQALAAHLTEFDAETHLFRRPYLRNWLGLFDTELAEQAEAISETYTDRPQVGLFKLKYLLDPDQPLVVDGHALYTVADLAERISLADESMLTAVEALLWGEFIEAWIETTQALAPHQHLTKAIARLRKRLKQRHRRLAVFSLLYLLDPQRPLPLTPDVAITHPTELESALARCPQASQGLLDLVNNGRFEEWLQVHYSDAETQQRVAAVLRSQSNPSPELLIYTARWCAEPTLGFPFSGRSVQQPAELARLIEHDDHTRQYAITLMLTGWLRTWLVATGQLAAPKKFDQLLLDPALDEHSKLEVVLSLLDPKLPQPQIRTAVPRANINCGRIPLGSSRRRTLRIRNAGRGYLNGIVRLAKPDPAIQLHKTTFQGNAVELSVSVDTTRLQVGTQSTNQLIIDSNGGTLTIPLSYRVGTPFLRLIREAVGAGTTVIAVLAALGALMYFANQDTDSAPQATEPSLRSTPTPTTEPVARSTPTPTTEPVARSTPTPTTQPAANRQTRSPATSPQVPTPRTLIADRYQVLGSNNDIIEDTTTGLHWQRCSVGQRWDGRTCTGQANRYSWHQLIAGEIPLPDSSGWRVPTKEELHTLVHCSSGKRAWSKYDDYSRCSGSYQRPTIVAEAFPNTPSGVYWSSSHYTSYGPYAWYVDFVDGHVNWLYKDNAYRVRLMRMGQ